MRFILKLKLQYYLIINIILAFRALKIKESVSGIHVKDYRELYQGYMLKIKESVSGKHVKE